MSAKERKLFYGIVDNYRRPSRKRNTVGRYIICAKNAQVAKRLLQEKIKFGSIQVKYYKNTLDKSIQYGYVVKEVEDNDNVIYIEAKSAIDKIDTNK